MVCKSILTPCKLMREHRGGMTEALKLCPGGKGQTKGKYIIALDSKGRPSGVGVGQGGQVEKQIEQRWDEKSAQSKQAALALSASQIMKPSADAAETDLSCSHGEPLGCLPLDCSLVGSSEECITAGRLAVAFSALASFLPIVQLITAQFLPWKK